MAMGMKKEVIFFIAIVFVVVILNISILSAQLNATEEQRKVDQAYSCLRGKVQGNCSSSSLSVEEKAFSLLAISQCQSELTSAANNNECWPETTGGNCKLKTTAQAVLALNNKGVNTNKAETWLLSQNKTAIGLEWYLEIESLEGETSCTIEYLGLDQSYSVYIDGNKKLNANAGPCLSLAQDDYWLQVSQSDSCKDQEFSISCDKMFLTALLFKKSDSSTINVFGEVSSAAAQGETKEKVKSFCFAEGGNCDYEGSLWATLVLSSLRKDISSYMPYLVSFADESTNQRFFPETFLYFITSDVDYKASILSKQKSNKFWLESGDKFYDTALALYPFRQETLTEKTNSKQWLLVEAQDSNGCWQDNVRNTAFILASVFPKRTTSGGGGDGLPDCTNAGYFCTRSGDCATADTISGYSCDSPEVCCRVEPEEKTCEESDGITCNSNQRCTGYEMSDVAGLNLGQTCCIGGSCQERETPEKPACESRNGTCRTSCLSNETLTGNYTCTSSADYCCIPASKKPSYTWIWILLILIALVIVGILFREKLRFYIEKIKKRQGEKGSTTRPGPPGFPSHPPLTLATRPSERKMIMHTPVQFVQRQQPQQIRKPVTKPKSGAESELDEVLKKLKEMSK